MINRNPFIVVLKLSEFISGTKSEDGKEETKEIVDYISKLLDEFGVSLPHWGTALSQCVVETVAAKRQEQ